MPPKRSRFCIALLIAALFLSGCADTPSLDFKLSKRAESYPTFSAELAYHHAAELASPRYEGRLPGEPGNALAAAYIANVFAEVGLVPGGDYQTYYQYFDPLDLSHSAATEVGVTNVIGLLPAPGAVHTVIVSAHFDHLGVRQEDGAVFHGAVDNAAGVGALLEIARALTKHKKTLPFNVEFVAFNCEEDGMVGSSYYLRARQEAARNILAVLNMDVVGVAGESSLTILDGQELSPLSKALKSTAQRHGLKTQWDGNNTRSDHAPFVAAGIPAITLLHYSEHYFVHYYHSPQDTIALVSPDKLREPAELIIWFLYDLAINYVAPPLGAVLPPAA